MRNVNDAEYWENIYLNNDTGWDLGIPTPVFEKISSEITTGKVIILGCGRGYDAVMFAKKGFEVTAVDFSPSAINYLKNIADCQSILVNTIQEDIFFLKEKFKGYFDYVIEQTCFCAIDPTRRVEYEALVKTILNDNGKLIGLWYPIGKLLSEGGPPWGISVSEIKSTFKKGWSVVKENYPKLSIEKRKNKEKLIIFKKQTK
jgi:methyl halide transferase